MVVGRGSSVLSRGCVAFWTRWCTVRVWTRAVVGLLTRIGGCQIDMPPTGRLLSPLYWFGELFADEDSHRPGGRIRRRLGKGNGYGDSDNRDAG